jgi:thioredoxin reductase (NADPH)
MNITKRIISASLLASILITTALTLKYAGFTKVYAERCDHGTCSINIEDAFEAKDVKPVVIIGSGPAALSAGLYASRGGVNTLVIRGNKPGGALTETSYIENWPGRMKVLGTTLMEELHEQVKQFGTEFLNDTVSKIDTSKWPYTIITDAGKKIRAMAIIVATGSTPRTLGVPGEREYWGKGVTTCAVCDAPFVKGFDVVVVGGGDTAAEEAMQLASYAKNITILVRSGIMRASASMKDRLKDYPNISIEYNKIVKEIQGDGDHVTQVILENSQTHETSKMPVQGVFLAIGHNPNTKLVQDFVNIDDNGYILLDGRSQQTSMPFIYAAGDVADDHYKQAGVAAGDGIKAALDALAALQDLGYSPKMAQRLAKNFFVVPDEQTKPITMINSKQELDEILNKAEGPVILDFYAEYCPSCMRMLPVVESVAYQLDKQVNFYKVDMDVPSTKEIAEKYNVKSIPALLVFNKGQVVGRYTQAMDKKELHEFVLRFVNAGKAMAA